MPMINLLPWREELRQKRKKEFLMAILMAVIVAGALSFGTKTFYKAKISNQEQRNQMLRTEIAELDRQIAEIDELDAQKQRLLDRLEIIEELERTTPEAVILVDSMVEVLPEGIYLDSLTQNGTDIDLTGRNQSNQRVSDMLRNIDESAWLTNAFPDIVENPEAGSRNDGQFRMTLNQIRLSDVDEELLQ